MSEPITIQAYFSKAGTLVDGGWRVSFDILQSESNNIAALSHLNGQPLTIVIMTEEALSQSVKEVKKKRSGNG